MTDGASERAAGPAEMAFAEYLRRWTEGEAVDFEAFCAAHPELAAPLRVLHSAHAGARSLLECPSFARVVEQSFDQAAEPHTVSQKRYQVRREIGRGGMGVVLEVWDEQLERPLAMKVLRGGGPQEIVVRSGSLVARFLAEAHITGQLDHPGIVPIHELGLDEEGRAYFTMALVEGEDLRRIFARARENVGSWNVTRALGVLVKVCEALAFAHTRGIIHRDLKPSNVMVGRLGQVYVMDWGLAKRVASGDGAQPELRSDGAADAAPVASPVVTLEGTVLGTPAYMPPEQAEGRVAKVDERSDVYSVGAMLYTLLTGIVPYIARGLEPSSEEVVAAVLAGPPRPIHELAPSVPAELTAVCEKAMARDPTRRYATMEELAEDLRAYLENRVVRAHRTGASAELRKWVARNRGTAAATGAALALALGALVVVVALQSASNRSLTTERDAKDFALREKQTALEKESAALAAEKASLEAKDAALRRAEGLRLVSESAALLGSSPSTALLLAIEGAHRAPGALANSALAAALDVLVEERTIPRHGEFLRCGTLSPDGRRIATAARDATVRIWTRASGKLELLLRGHEREVTWVAWSPDGARLASSCWDATARVWDAESGRQLAVLRHGGVVDRVLFSPSGASILTVCRDGNARLWEAASGRLRCSLVGHQGPIPHGAFGSRGRLAVTASHDGTAIVWDLERGEALHVLRGHQDRVVHAEIDADGKLAVTASIDGRARVWSIETGGCLAVLERHSGSVTAATFIDGGRGVVTSSVDGTGILWDVESARAVAMLAGDEDEMAAVVLDPARRLALTSSGRRAALWRLPQLPAAPPASPQRLQPLAELAGHEERIVSAELSAGGDVAVTTSLDGTARIWSVSRAFELGRPREIKLPGRWVLSADACKVVTFGHGSVARVVDAASGELLALLEGHAGWISKSELSPDGRRIATASFDRTARIWSAETGEVLHVLSGHRAELDYVAFSPDGARVVTGSRDWDSRVWDVEHGTQVARLATRGWVWAPRFCRDGELLVASVDWSVHVWEPSRAEHLRTYTGHRAAVYFSWARPGSPWVLTVSIDNACLVWDTNTATTIASLEGHEGEVAAAAFDDNGRGAATLDLEGTVRAWSLPEGAPRLVVRTGARGPARLAFSPDGTEVVSKVLGGSRRRWPLEPLAEALARRPRDLSIVESQRFEIGDADERARAFDAERQAAAETERIACARMWSRDRANQRARHEVLERTRLLVEALLARSETHAALAVAERALEWDGGRDPVIGWSLAAAHAQGGDLAAGARILDAARILPRAKAGFLLQESLFADWCRRLAPDVVSCAAVDLLLAQRSRLVSPADQLRIWRGSRGVLSGDAWMEVAFDDAAWEQGAGPIGFGDVQCRTQLGDMPGRYTSLFVRSRFHVADPDALSCLRASVRTSDDCVVWVNGRELARVVQHAPGSILRLGADAEHALRPEAPRETTEVVIEPGWLVPGDNIIGLACVTASLADPSLLLGVEVEAERRVDAGLDQELLTRFRNVASDPHRELRERYFEGRVLARARRHREAVVALRAACAAGPEPLAACRLAESLRALGEDDEAARLLDDLVENGPAVAEDEPRILLAAAARIVGRPDRELEPYVRAARWAHRAAELVPRDPAPHAILGAACFRAALPARGALAFKQLEAALSLIAVEANLPPAERSTLEEQKPRPADVAAVEGAVAILRRSPPPAASGRPSPELEAAIQALLAPWW